MKKLMLKTFILTKNKMLVSDLKRKWKSSCYSNACWDKKWKVYKKSLKQ